MLKTSESLCRKAPEKTSPLNAVTQTVRVCALANTRSYIFKFLDDHNFLYLIAISPVIEC